MDQKGRRMGQEGDELAKRAKKGDELTIVGLGEVPLGWKKIRFEH
jgi:hypothetical protein